MREDLGVFSAALAKEFDGTGVSVRVHDTLPSTNTEAKRLAVEGERGPLLVTAIEQTAGRGRMGRNFYSPAEGGAYFSFLYCPSVPLENAVTVTSAAAVAVMQAISELTGVQTDIKWVNDLYLRGKKACGILCESVVADGVAHVILGIGINLSTEVFPRELADKAASLGVCVDRAALIRSVWAHLLPYIEDPTATKWLEPYRAHSCVIGRPIEWRVGEETHRGTAVGIDAHGGLEVRDEHGTVHILRTGEISVRIK